MKLKDYSSDLMYIGPRGTAPDGFVNVPKGNDRMFDIVLFNRGRRTSGTATVWRLMALFSGIAARYPKCWKTPKKNLDQPIIVRNKRAGRVVMIVKSLPGPVASIATRQ